jgi:hypothetical protein
MKTMAISTHCLPVALRRMYCPPDFSIAFPAISFSSHSTTPLNKGHPDAMNLSFCENP